MAVDRASCLPRWYICTSTSDLTCSQCKRSGSSITLWAAKTVSKPIVKLSYLRPSLAMTILLREKVRGKEKPPILLKSLSHGFFGYFSQLFVFFAHSLSSPASSSSLWSLSLCTASSNRATESLARLRLGQARSLAAVSGLTVRTCKPPMIRIKGCRVIRKRINTRKPNPGCRCCFV
jgi:hypothetical protein